MTEIPENLDLLLGSIANLLAAEGSAKEVALVATADASIEQTSFDNWNGGTNGYTLTLGIPPHLFAQIQDAREAFEESIKARAAQFFRRSSNDYLEAVRIVPSLSAGPDWREKAKAWVSGRGLTNQGRVRSDNIAARKVDGLLFRSQQEINLYRALKSTGVPFAPLPVFLRGGPDYRRIEPDFIIIKNGIVLHVEVDGDTVHQETPAEAHARTSLLLHEGAFVERVLASDCDDEAKAEACAQRLLDVMAKHLASR
jgi:hypothetical protein